MNITEEQKMYWHNFITGEYEYISTPDDFAAYIPQIKAAQALYRLYVDMNLSPLEAAVKVLEACVGEAKGENDERPND